MSVYFKYCYLIILAYCAIVYIVRFLTNILIGVFHMSFLSDHESKRLLKRMTELNAVKLSPNECLSEIINISSLIDLDVSAGNKSDLALELLAHSSFLFHLVRVTTQPQIVDEPAEGLAVKVLQFVQEDLLPSRILPKEDIRPQILVCK
jgi:hypothetical protein